MKCQISISSCFGFSEVNLMAMMMQFTLGIDLTCSKGIPSHLGTETSWNHLMGQIGCMAMAFNSAL